ncbi:MAG TPA: hypothetical protein DDW23_00800 [Planctomycetes bacterium]|nr:hypothetical protein [Planctomycetota bacterium]
MNTSPIKCHRLSRFYGEVQGLSELTVQAGPGVVGLLGPNGSGKTTFMRLLCGLIHPSRGSVEICGSAVGPGNRELLRKVGYAPGEDVHFENEKALDFLAFLSALGGDSPTAARKRGEEALAKVDLADRGQHQIKTLSKGMRQRIKVAQALLFSPEILLLDEPLNGMDPVSRKALLDLVLEHGNSGGTVLLASHVLHEIETVTDQVVLLHHGRLLAEGKLSDIRSLIDQKPRRLTLKSQNPREIVTALLNENLITSVEFKSDNQLAVETKEIQPLLRYLQNIGKKGGIDQLELSDQNLESVFELLVGSKA